MQNTFYVLQDLIQQKRRSSNKLMEFTPFGYMWVRLDNRKLVASHTIYSMLEKEPFAEFFTVETWRSFVHPKDLYKLLQAEEELLHTGNPTLADYRLITQSGRHIFVSHHMYLSGSVHRDRKIISIIQDVTEQKGAEIILEAMNESFLELDENFALRRINAHAIKFWKLDHPGMIAKKLTAIFPEIEGTAFNNILLKAQSEKINIAQDVTDPVTGHWLHLSVTPYADGLIVIFYDIQNEKEFERKVKQSESYYHSLVENTPDVITRWNKDLKLIFANSAFEVRMGMPNKDLYGKTNKEMGQPDEITVPYVSSLRTVFETGETEEHFNSFPSPSGEVHFFSRIVPEKNEKGEVETVLAIARDITEIRKAEQRIHDEHQNFKEAGQEILKQHSILKQAEELAQAGSWEYNLKTKEFLLSDGMYRLFEMNKDEPVSPSIYLRYSLEDDLGIAKKIVNSIENKFESFEEIMRIKSNDSYKTLRIKGAPLKNENDEIEKMLGVDIDISQAQHAEGKIMDLNRSLFATNRELNSMNTELKTFANVAANNYSETLKHLYINLEMIVTNDARNLSNSGRANLRRAQGAIQKMKLTTDDLLSFSRLHEIGVKENNVDLNIILEKVVEDFRKQPGHSLIMINCDHLPLMNGYPLLLSLLFHHLMDNGIKFRKKDNDHIINVTCKEAINGNDIAHDDAEKNVKYYIISVEDNGIGFPQAESEKIFEMFSRLNEKGKYKGPGTGLALCKKIMEMHGGFITAEGKPDEGASFHCYFPA